MSSWHIIVVGIAIFTTCYFVVRKLHSLHARHNKIDGELFISDSGEMYSEFGISVEELVTKDYILMKVNHVTMKGDEKK